MLFYWIEEGRLAGGACPRAEELRALGERGFDAVISLLADPAQAGYGPDDLPEGMRGYRLPMRDHATPTLAELAAVHEVLDSLPAGSRAYVHCYAGIGRTGTVGASCLVKRGIDVEEALRRVDAWTDGWFRVEIQGREEEVRSLLRRFRERTGSRRPG